MTMIKTKTMQKQIDQMLDEYEAAVEALERRPTLKEHQTFCRGASVVLAKARSLMTDTQVQRLQDLDSRAFD